MLEIMFILAIIVGFVAQIVDGTLGMGYGITSNTFLISLGIPPAMSSASVHTSEVFTTAASGISHIRCGNFDKKLFKKLLIPGAIGGFLGAYVLVSIPGYVTKPFISIYLLLMGFVILIRALRYKIVTKATTGIYMALLGGFGGFLDAIGGGGWGPIVTSTLLAKGHNPRIVIGSINTVEFFVTIIEVATFFAFLRTSYWHIIVGMIIGGIIAAPLAARICKKLTPKILMFLIGIAIMVLSIKNVYDSVIIFEIFKYH